VKYYWWGFDVWFFKGEICLIVMSISGCIIVVGMIFDFIVFKVVVVVCGVLIFWVDVV